MKKIFRFAYDTVVRKMIEMTMTRLLQLQLIFLFDRCLITYYSLFFLEFWSSK